MTYTESEIPTIVTAGNNGGGFGNFGGEGLWAVIILAIIFGWGNYGGFGRGGYGYGGGTDAGAINNYVLSSDFSQLSRQISDTTAMTERKLDGIANGICDSTFALNNTIVNGHNAIQSTLCQGFSGLNTALVQQGYETRLGINGVQTQLSDCCCQLKGQLAENKYEMAQNFAGLNYNMAKNTCDIIQAGKDNTQRIVDIMNANKLEAKNDIIAQQQATISALQLKASQEAQNAYLLNALKPQPSPAFIVPNPNCCYNQCNCGGCGTSIQ